MAKLTDSGAPDPKLVILAAEGGSQVQMVLDEKVPIVDDDSYSGFSKMRRPQRRGVPKWEGLPCPSVSFGVMLDGMTPGARPSVSDTGGGRYVVAGASGPGVLSAQLLPTAPEGISVRPAMRALEEMTSAFVSNDPYPPLLTVTAPRVPHDQLKARQNRWYLGGLSWKRDRAVTSETTGEVIRMFADLTLLLESGASDLLSRVEPLTGEPRYRTVIARSTDTYNSIAVAELGSQRLGRKLAKLNGERDPSKHPGKGKRVRLPTAHTLRIWRDSLK